MLIVAAIAATQTWQQIKKAEQAEQKMADVNQKAVEAQKQVKMAEKTRSFAEDQLKEAETQSKLTQQEMQKANQELAAAKTELEKVREDAERKRQEAMQRVSIAEGKKVNLQQEAVKAQQLSQEAAQSQKIAEEQAIAAQQQAAKAEQKTQEATQKQKEYEQKIAKFSKEATLQMVGIYGVPIKTFEKLQAQQLSTATPVTLLPVPLSDQPSNISNRIFLCGMSQGNPATLVRTVRGPMTVIIWTNEEYTASGWTPERRCKESSARFERLNRSGQLKYLKAGTVSGQSVICGTDSRESLCSSNNVLVALPSGTDANLALNHLLNIRVGASSRPLYL